MDMDMDMIVSLDSARDDELGFLREARNFLYTRHLDEASLLHLAPSYSMIKAL